MSLFYETTPRVPSKKIIRFCRSISKMKPVFVDVKPVDGALPSECFFNVLEHVERQGGVAVHGWIIWKSKMLLHAEFHAVWRNSDGTLVDITPKEDGEGRVLFLPDPDREYCYRPEPGKRCALRGDAKEVARLLDRHAELLLSTFRGRAAKGVPPDLDPRRLPPDELVEYRSIERSLRI